MKKILILITIFSGYRVYAGYCMDLGASDDGTPAPNQQQECLGKGGLKKGEYFAAEEQCKKAMYRDYHDITNYHP